MKRLGVAFNAQTPISLPGVDATDNVDYALVLGDLMNRGYSPTRLMALHRSQRRSGIAPHQTRMTQEIQKSIIRVTGRRNFAPQEVTSMYVPEELLSKLKARLTAAIYEEIVEWLQEWADVGLNSLIGPMELASRQPRAA